MTKNPQMTPAATGAHTLVLLPGMDGSGALFADFIAALGDAVAPVVVSYPPDLPLDYAALAAFSQRAPKCALSLL